MKVASNRLYFCCFTNSDPVNSKGESLKSLAESLGLSDVITYLETFSADSAGGIRILHIRVLALEFPVNIPYFLDFFCPQILLALVLYSCKSFNEFINNRPRIVLHYCAYVEYCPEAGWGHC